MALNIGEFDVKDFQRFAALDDSVARREAKQTQDLFCSWTGTLTLLWIERQFLNFLALHCQSHLTFNERLDQ